MPDTAASPRCPNNDGFLRPVTATSHLGQKILLDQCETCGGIWFDRFELFQVEENEAERLDGPAAAAAPIDKQALRDPRGAHEQPLCPKCLNSLQVFRDANIPENIQMMICGVCEGLWLNHGALLSYAGFRHQHHKRPDPALAEQYEKMLSATSKAEYWQGMSNLAHKVGGRRDMLTGLPLDGTPDQLDRIDRAHDMAFSLMRTAVRLLFGF